MGVGLDEASGGASMRKLIAFEWMSLDGVVQAPTYPNEDASGGFTHGGRHLPYFALGMCSLNCSAVAAQGAGCPAELSG